MRWVCFVVAVSALFGLAGGCSSNARMVLAKGQLTFKGQPYKASPKGSVTIVFTPVVKPGENYSTFPASFRRDDSTFTVPGTDGRGIPEGKYRISINQIAFPTPADVKKLNDLFSADKTSILREVKSADEPILIDLAKPAG